MLRGNWQDFNWHDASRRPSAIAELLVLFYMAIVSWPYIPWRHSTPRIRGRWRWSLRTDDHRRCTARIIGPLPLVTHSGAAMGWAGWPATSTRAPSAGARPRVPDKKIKIIFPLQWKLGHLHVCETFNGFADFFSYQLRNNAFGGRAPPGPAGGAIAFPHSRSRYKGWYHWPPVNYSRPTVDPEVILLLGPL